MLDMLNEFFRLSPYPNAASSVFKLELPSVDHEDQWSECGAVFVRAKDTRFESVLINLNDCALEEFSVSEPSLRSLSYFAEAVSSVVCAHLSWMGEIECLELVRCTVSLSQTRFRFLTAYDSERMMFASEGI